MYKKIVFTLLLINAFLVSAQEVKLGIDILKESGFDVLTGKRVGLITNHTGVDSNLKSTIDILHEASNVNLVALYAPEHGVRGNVYAGSKVNNQTDTKTKLSVFSLYGKTQKPTKEMLKDIDVLVYDIQDIGCRSYTYISTMGLAMEAAAENNIRFVVLDRPNPLGGKKIEGPLVEKGYTSFVSQYSIPYVYGLTCGELANFLNEENMLAKKCNLTVISMEGWESWMNWEDTGLEWVMTSPHIPHKHSPYFYPMTGILGELNFVSIGVGYTLPFEMIGAPWINADALVDALQKLDLPGVVFRPVYYKPFYGMYKGEQCEGIQIHLVDYYDANLTLIQFYIMQELHRLYPDKTPFANDVRNNMFDKVVGTNKIRVAFSKNFKVSDIDSLFNKDIDSFRERAIKYYLYK